MKKSHFWWLTIGSFFVALIAPFLYFVNFSSKLSSNDSAWNNLGGYLGGTLGPFFAFLSVVITAYIAYTLKNFEENRDQTAKRQNDLKSYLELYQYFTGPEFREKRQIAWKVLRRGLINSEYAAFIIQETMMTRYTDRMLRPVVYEKFKDLYEEPMDQKKFLHVESEDRHKLDAVINFFELLAYTDMPDNCNNECDFYYDSWRPLLYWYAKRIEKAYKDHEVNRRHTNPPKLSNCLAILDKKYFNPELPITLTMEDIEEHPLIDYYLRNPY